MRFDWQRFCSSRLIPFETGGPRVSKGNINIRCPYCGAADKSGHMGLSLDPRNPVWGCLRNAQHRGRDPARLVAKVLGLAYRAARAMVDAEGPLLDDFERAVDGLRHDAEPAAAKALKVLDLPKEFRRLCEGEYAFRFVDYLAERRRFYDDTYELAVDYGLDLYYAMSGDQAWRLIFPVRDAAGVLQGWTGRDIRRQCRIRYLTSEELPTDALCSFGVKGDLTIVCEGPMDALKLDFYGRPMGISAVATMGTGAASMVKAAAIRARYPDAVVVFDSDATGQALEFAEELRSRAFTLPQGFKDPGELTADAAKLFLQHIAEKSCI